MILIPRYLLKPLPIAANIEDALDVADLNAQARAEVNRIYAEAHRGSVSRRSRTSAASFFATPRSAGASFPATGTQRQCLMTMITIQTK